jgi:hypothetical protein
LEKLRISCGVNVAWLAVMAAEIRTEFSETGVRSWAARGASWPTDREPNRGGWPSKVLAIQGRSGRSFTASVVELARIIHQELADVVYPFEISYDFAVESQNPRIQRPAPAVTETTHLCPACHLFLASR